MISAFHIGRPKVKAEITETQRTQTQYWGVRLDIDKTDVYRTSEHERLDRMRRRVHFCSLTIQPKEIVDGLVALVHYNN